MGQGRGSAKAAMAVLCLLLVHVELGEAATYTVGGTVGWTFNVATWPNGKRFKAGDTLAFNYNPAFHNVVVVNKVGYNSCVAPTSARVFQTGKDQIKLTKGANYFICSFTGHCQSGMKIAVTAT